MAAIAAGEWRGSSRLKAQRVSPGFPDITIWPHLDPPLLPILFVEIKRAKGGTVSGEQKEWHEYLDGLEGLGYPVQKAVCRGFVEARNFIISKGY
jgi:hypothetical protein